VQSSAARGHGSVPPTINEDLEDEDSEDDDGQDAAAGGGAAAAGSPLGGDRAAAVAEGTAAREAARNVEFELPAPNLIFKDTKNKALWKDFTAAQTSFKFDGKAFTRSAAVKRVFLRHKPFMQGGMRLVYGMVLDEGANAPDENMMCAKRLFQDLEKDRGFNAHSAFCRCTAVATHYARIFRQMTKSKLGFLQCSLYSPVGSNEEGYHFCGENWMKGHFVKLNSNAGFVNEVDYSDHSAIAQAFSHFTFDHSNGELLVVDLQGVCGSDEQGEPYFLLTDPQVHSRGGFERFGQGDFGDHGVTTFFQKHKCGPLCQQLGLRKEFNLRNPTHEISMPGVSDCITYLLGSDDGKDFFASLRETCRISSITVPREAHKEWLNIRMWATRTGGRKAEELLRKRLQGYYDQARTVVPAEPQPQWDTARWHAQLELWKRESGAAIVLHPPNWQETRVDEIWVFSELRQEEGARGTWYYHRNASFASQQIKEALEKAQGEDPAETQGAADTAVADKAKPQIWAQYQDRHGAKYWYREPDGLWFWESDPQWQRFFDADSENYWWWNAATGNWFHEPRRA